MIYSLLADLVVIIHLLFIPFAIFGALLALRWRWVVWLHIPAITWVVVLELNRLICPLTPLENYLRHAAGQAGYSGGFIEHYLMPIIYPIGLTPTIQWILGISVLVLNVILYSWLLYRWRKSRHQAG